MISKHKLQAPAADAISPNVGDDQRQTLNAIVALGQVTGQSAKAEAKAAAAVPDYSGTGLSSIPGGTMTTLAVFQLYDASTDNPFGPGAWTQQFGGGQNVQVTQTSAPAAAITDVGGLLQVTYQQNPTVDPVTLTYQTSVQGMPVTPPNVTAPAHVFQNPPNTNIKVCLSRNTVPDPNCDYGPYQSPTANPIVQMPVTGNISFTSNVDTTRLIAGTLVVWAKDGGGGCTLTLDAAQFAKAFTIPQGQPATVNWTFYHMDGSTQVNTASFGLLNNNACWTPDQPYGMTLDASVPIVGVLLPQQFYVTTTSGPSIGNVTRISSLNFTWGCFAAGSKVLMADGTVKAIEEVRIGDSVVADRSGRRLTVRELTQGTESLPMVVLTDSLGHQLSITEGHAMVTRGDKGAEKVVLAKELKEGDEVFTSDLALDKHHRPRNFKTAKIAKIERQKYDGFVYNVYLGAKEKGDLFTRANTTLIVDGVMSGDNGMQEYFGAEWNFRPKNVKDRISPEWHKDYENFLKMPQPVTNN